MAATTKTEAKTKENTKGNTKSAEAKPSGSKVSKTVAEAKLTVLKVSKTVAESAHKSMLFDYYGSLLSDRQREVFGLYNEDNYSLGEISEAYGISRQGVHDALRKAELELKAFETNLGMVKKHEQYLKALAIVEEVLDALIADETIAAIPDRKDKDRIRRRLLKIRKTVGDLDV